MGKKVIIYFSILLLSMYSKSNAIDNTRAPTNNTYNGESIVWTPITNLPVSAVAQQYIDLSSIKVKKLNLNTADDMDVVIFNKKTISTVSFDYKQLGNYFGFVGLLVNLSSTLKSNNCCVKWNNSCQKYIDKTIKISPQIHINLANGGKKLCLLNNGTKITEMSNDTSLVFDKNYSMLLGISLPSNSSLYLDDKTIIATTQTFAMRSQDTHDIIISSENLFEIMPWVRQYLIPKINFFRSTN